MLPRFVVSPAATEEMEVASEEQADELETEEVVATAVVEELPPTPPAPVERRRIHREWLAADAEGPLSHHVTIGPSGGIEWVSYRLSHRI